MQDKKWWLVLALSLLSIGANFWDFPVYILDEAKNAGCAMEMMQRNDWVVPTFNDRLRTDKPPLHYYFMIAGYSMFGVSPFSARFFSVVLGLMTVAVVYFFTKQMAGARAAFYSALILACSLHFTIQFHLAVPDPYLIFFLTLSLLAFLYAWQGGGTRYYFGTYVALALAFMAKGPVAVVLAGISILAFMLYSGRFSMATLGRIKLWQGILLFLAITVPWWASVAIATKGEWPAGFILGHNVGRFIAPMEGHAAFPGLAILLLIIGLLPLSFYLPGAIKTAWKDRTSNVLAIFSLIAVVTITGFFLFSKTVLPSYVAPAIPFGAILLGSFIDRSIERKAIIGKSLKMGSIITLAVTMILPFALKGAIVNDQWISDMTWVSWLFLPIPIGALFAVIFLFRNQWINSLYSYLLSCWLTGILLFYAAVPGIFEKNPVSQSVEIIRESQREVVGYYFFNSAYVFAFQKPLPTFYTPQDLKAYSIGKSVIVVTRKEYVNELMGVGFKVVFEKPYLFESSVSIVMIN